MSLEKNRRSAKYDVIKELSINPKTRTNETYKRETVSPNSLDSMSLENSRRGGQHE